MVHVVHNHTVQHVERTYRVERAHTTYLHLTHGTRLTRCVHLDTRHLTLQHLVDVGGCGLLSLFHVHYGHSSRQVRLLLCTVTDDDNVLEHLGVRFHDHVDRRASGYGHCLLHIAHIGKLQLVVLACSDRVLTVIVSDGHCLSALHSDGDADERLTVLSIRHRTLHRLGIQSQGQAQQQHQHGRLPCKNSLFHALHY